MRTTAACCYYSEETPIPVIMQAPPKLTYKISILGDSGSGKTTLIHRLLHGCLPDVAQATIGVGYHNYEIDTAEDTIKCQVWDTAGQERFGSLVPVYIRGTDLCLITFNLAESKNNIIASLAKWTAILRDVTEQSRIIVVGTKNDLMEADTPAQLLELQYVSTSSVTGAGLDQLQLALEQEIRSVHQALKQD